MHNPLERCERKVLIVARVVISGGCGKLASLQAHTDMSYLHVTVHNGALDGRG